MLVTPRSPRVYEVLLFQALEEYDMIRDGDRVMVCLSGGKDSLSLLHTLRQYQFYSRSKVCPHKVLSCLNIFTVFPRISARLLI